MVSILLYALIGVVLVAVGGVMLNRNR